MIYSFTGRVRFSETDKDSILTFPSMLDYFQDTSTFHGEDCGLPIEMMKAENLAWILGAWQIRLYGEAKLGDTVTASTWAYDFRHCLGYRNYSLRAADGRLLAAADTQYVLMNSAAQTPAHIPAHFAEGYTLEKEARIDLGLSRKIAPAKPETALDPVTVSPYMIDTNNHVNNVQYIKTAMTCLPEAYAFNCFRAEYKKQAHLGDVLYPCRSAVRGGIQIKLYDEAHSLYFIGEWTTAEA